MSTWYLWFEGDPVTLDYFAKTIGAEDMNVSGEPKERMCADGVRRNLFRCSGYSVVQSILAISARHSLNLEEKIFKEESGKGAVGGIFQYHLPLRSKQGSGKGKDYLRQGRGTRRRD